MPGRSSDAGLKCNVSVVIRDASVVVRSWVRVGVRVRSHVRSREVKWVVLMSKV